MNTFNFIPPPWPLLLLVGYRPQSSWWGLRCPHSVKHIHNPPFCIIKQQWFVREPLWTHNVYCLGYIINPIMFFNSILYGVILSIFKYHRWCWIRDYDQYYICTLRVYYIGAFFEDNIWGLRLITFATPHLYHNYHFFATKCY